MSFDLDLFASIDPASEIGWFAFWQRSLLIGVGVFDAWRLPDEPRQLLPREMGAYNSCVVEVPRIRPKGTRQGSADPNDVLSVVLSAGRLTRQFDHVQRVAPEAWKGQQPKDAAFRRSLKALTQPEVKVLGAFFHALSPRSSARAFQDPTEKQLNVWDTVGIGLWRLGRTGPA